MPKKGHEALRRRTGKLLRSALRLPRRLAHAARVALEILRWTVTLQLRAGLRRRAEARLLRRSALFDVRHYLAQCEGDEGARRDPFTHYLVVGAARGFDPSPLFDTSAYAERNRGAAGENPLVHYLRSNRVPREAPGSSVPDAVDPGEALLLKHPFRTPATEPEPGHVLVIGPDGASATADPGAVRLSRLVGVARKVGPVVFVAGDASGGGVDSLRQHGIVVLTGFAAALAHLEAEGHRCRAVLVSGPEQAARYLAPARAYAAQATLVYDAYGPDEPGRDPGTVLADGGLAVGPAQELRRAETVSAACSDVVLARTVEDRDRLLRDVPGARVEVIADAADRLASVLTGVRASPVGAAAGGSTA